jgi:sterol desaturase/sphingolipid hydroxylase (fatty acid hydroxylase superfamily)
LARLESHSAHHERGVHARNYSDLTLFDMLFGSFHNPREFVPATGFYDGASARVAEMLVFKDVSRSENESGALAIAVPGARRALSSSASR